MSLLDSIDAFITDTVTVTRTTGDFVNGIYTILTTTTFPAALSIQPATGLARVIGGKDMHSVEEGEFTWDVRQFFTRVQLKPRTSSTSPRVNRDPDVITFDGSDWTVTRAEPWTYSGETFYRCVMTRKTFGAS